MRKNIQKLALGLSLAGLLAAGGAMAADRELTVYTYDSFVSDWGPGPVVKKAFEAECDCTLNWVGIADGVALLNRLKLEGEKTRADIVLGLDTNLVTEAKNTGLFEPSGIDQSNIDVPGDWSDDVFVPYDYGYFAVVYDTEAMQTPPSSMKELVEGDPDQKIIIQDPRTSTPGLGLLLWVRKIYGDDAPQAWEILKNRVLTVTPGWSEAYGAFTKGRFQWYCPTRPRPPITWLPRKPTATRPLPSTRATTCRSRWPGSSNRPAKRAWQKEFLEFMTGPGFQDAIPTTNWMFPAGKTSEPLPGAFDKLVNPSKTLLYSADEVSANRKVWVDEWLAVMSD